MRSPPQLESPVRLSTFAPGKVILLGEHGVVYGHPALAAPLSIGVRATGDVTAQEVSLEVPSAVRDAARHQLSAAFDAAVVASGLKGRGLRVRIESDLPLSMGLGSSAAVAVACGRVLLKAASENGKEPSARDVSRVAWAMEQVFHGTPSGVDHTTSARAELIHFRRAPDGDPSKAKIATVKAKEPLGLVVVLAGARPATKATVSALRARQAKWPKRYVRVFEEIGTLVDEARGAISRGDLELVGDLMNMNQGMLAGLGLSSAGIEAAVHRLRVLGALGAKLTGAGGDGGAVIGLFEKPEQAVTKLKREGVHSFTSWVGR